MSKQRSITSKKIMERKQKNKITQLIPKEADKRTKNRWDAEKTVTHGRFKLNLNYI